MPQITLEYPKHIKKVIDFNDLFKQLHSVLLKTGEFKPDQIKSRAYGFDEYMVGEGNPGKIFIHLKNAILDTRPEEFRKQIASELSDVLVNYFRKNIKDFECQICVEMQNIDSKTYSIKTINKFN